MTEAARQPKDKNYNLISVLYHSSDNVESLKTYIHSSLLRTAGCAWNGAKWTRTQPTASKAAPVPSQTA
jgi:hypothetical protein